MSEAHRELSAFVARVRRRWLTCVLLRTAGIAALSASLPVAAAVLCERLFHPEGRTLVLLAVLTLGFATASAAWAVSRMQRRPGDVRVARFIEERLALDPAVGSLDDAVVTAVSAASDPADQAAPLGAALAAVAVRRLRGLSRDPSCRRRRCDVPRLWQQPEWSSSPGSPGPPCRRWWPLPRARGWRGPRNRSGSRWCPATFGCRPAAP